MKKLISLILCAVLLTSLCACSAGGSGDGGSVVPVSDGQAVGKGAVSFPLTIVDDKGSSISITVNTDKETVGEALAELGIIEGEDSEYGMYIMVVNGVEAIYEETGTYWSFYVNDAYAMAGIDLTPIVAGESYKLLVEDASNFN